MSLTKKMILTVVMIIAIYAVFFLSVAQWIVELGFTGVGTANAQKHMQLILRTFDSRLIQLEQAETNYSIWDDTVAFMNHTHDQAWNTYYLQNNYPASTFIGNRFNVIIMLNPHGQTVFQRAFDLASNHFIPVPKDLIPEIKQHAPQLLHYTNGDQYQVGLLNLPEGPLLLAAEPIVKSDYSGPVSGTMIVAQFLNTNVLSSLSYNTELSIHMMTQHISIPPKGSQLVTDSPIRFRVWYVKTGASRVTADTVLYGLNGRAAILFQVQSDPQIPAESQRTVQAFAIFSIIIFILLSGSGIWIFEWGILRRLRSFQKQLTLIHQRHLSTRVRMRGHDEIAKIAEEFNQLMRSLKTTQKQLIYQARHDDLTGLPNRDLFIEILQTQLRMAKQYQQKLAILFIDLDKFKAINDTFGHDSGDFLLKQFAERLAQCIGKKDLLARHAGDEFTILLKSVKATEDVQLVAKKIMAEMVEPIAINENWVFVRASIGGAIYPQDGETPDQLINHADTAMYYAKKNGSQFLFISESMKQHMERTRKLEIDLKTAVSDNEMFLMYQPKIDLQTLKIIGTEALVRWNHPEFGLIPPGEFIDIAENTPSIIDIGSWVLETACKQNMRWIQQGDATLPVSVNVSPTQFAQDNFVEVVQGALAKTELPHHLLELEITEGVAMMNIADVINKLHMLKSLGIQISLDDFGTGYSSLNYLTYLPVDILKLDRSFMTHIASSQKHKTIVQAIIDLAHRLDIQVLTEGVETQEQLDFLMKNGCDLAQGYFFSPPVTTEQIIPLFVSSRP